MELLKKIIPFDAIRKSRLRAFVKAITALCISSIIIIPFCLFSVMDLHPKTFKLAEYFQNLLIVGFASGKIYDIIKKKMERRE